jgi:hypothetical protein
LLGNYPDLHIPGFADCGNSKIGQIVNELGAAAKIAADRNFDVSKRVAKSYKPISEQIDTEKVRIREDFGPYRVLKFKRTGYPGLAP